MGFIKIQYIIVALLIFGVLIFVHELGHYLAARLFKVSIHEFAIGMGPKIFGRISKKTGIQYSLRILPIGGYVSMEGENQSSADENAFSNKPVWQRMIITVAGAAMNILIGILVMSVIVICQKALPSTTIYDFNYEAEVQSNQYGLQPGDTVIAVNDEKIELFYELSYIIIREGIEPLDITVLRNGETIVLHDVVFPTEQADGALFGKVDFIPYAEHKTPVTVLRHAVHRSVLNLVMIWDSLFDLFTGRYGMESVSGPVGVTEALGEAAERDSMDFFTLAVVISMNLGVMNLLPLPALDGGRLAFQIIELIRRKPVRTEVEGYIHFAGLVLLMILMVVITGKDIVNLR